MARTAGSTALAVEQVKRALPDLESLPLEEGKRALREKSLSEFRAAAKESEAELKLAQERLERAQKGQSDAEKQAARKGLQQLHAEQAEKLKTIAIALQDQIAALEQLKRDAP
jgi:hypothetical protein